MGTATKQPSLKAESPKLKSMTLAQLLATDFPIRDHLIFPWLRQGESAMLFAAPGVGKSMLVLSLALAVAGGGEVLGWECHKPRKVVFWDGEMYVDDLKTRAEMLARYIPGIDMRVAGENLTFIARQGQDHNLTFPDIAEKVGQEAVFHSTIHFNADLIILDNLSTLALAIEDENAAAEFNKVMGLLMRLKQANKACILVHHSNKTGTDYRGSSKMATTFEVMFGLCALNNIKSREGTAFDLQWTKYRGKRDQSMCGQEVWLGKDKEGVLGWQREVSKKDSLAVLVEMVRSMEYGSQKALAEAVNISQGELSKRKTQAFASGMIKENEWNNCFITARQIAQEKDPYGLKECNDDPEEMQGQPLGDF